VRKLADLHLLTPDIPEYSNVTLLSSNQTWLFANYSPFVGLISYRHGIDVDVSGAVEARISDEDVQDDSFTTVLPIENDGI
jgi:hypothetical protein